MDRLRIIAAIVMASVGWTCRGPARPAKPPRPNVLLVVLDTTRADYLSCYGYPAPTTPHLDRLAAEGTLYRRAFATDFWTLPSHASLLTGLYPGAAGATSETSQLPAAAVTLAERLRQAGYATGAVVRNAWLSEERGFAQGFDDFVESWRGDDEVSELVGEHAAVDAATAWLEEHVGGPSFLFVNLNIAHLPYTPAEELRRRFAAREWPPEQLARAQEVQGGWAHLTGTTPLGETDFLLLRELYAAEVAQADELAGRLLDALRQGGTIDDTLVIVTSDHGENLGEHGLIDHVNSMYDTTLRVPLLVRYPPRFAAGSVVDDLVSLVDVVPTVLDACGLTEGLDVTRSLGRRDRRRRRAVFAENARPLHGIERLRRYFPHFDATVIDHRLRVIRTERHKLIWKVGTAAELFDLEADPGETVDLADTRQELRNELLAALREWTLGLEMPGAVERFESRDAEALERLRALGYVE